MTVSLDVLVADSAAAARELALPEAWALAAARTPGQFPALEPADAARPLTGRQREVVEQAVGRTVHGDEVGVGGSPTRGWPASSSAGTERPIDAPSGTS
ncbi:MAG: hypothetical protein L0H64_13930 [Pseudonocardia sp.]|nr:hypothetical protein [Pseudonocardia sp.]